MDDALDLAKYDDLVVEHGLRGYLRYRAFSDRAEGRAWQCDLTVPNVSIDGIGEYAMDLLGTVSAEDLSFLWAWANPGAGEWAPAVLAFAESLAARARREPGLAAFSERKVAKGWVPFEELASVCSELAGGAPLYIGGAGETGVLMLVRCEVGAAVTVDLPSLPGLLLDFQQTTFANVRACVDRFLSKEFALVPSDNATCATRKDGSITIDWSDTGRIANVKMHLAPVD